MVKKLSKETKLTLKNYKENPDKEWKRLVKDDFHKLELNRTMDAIEGYIPSKGHILDAGWWPGRYSVLLAKKWYDITLTDLVPEHIALAKKVIKEHKVQHKMKNILEWSITDLSQFKNNTFDAVLCLWWPLSHIQPASERQKAIKELIRVAKKWSYIFVSVMSKYACLLAGIDGRPEELEDKKQLIKLIKTGDDYRWRGDGFCHFFTGEELANVFKKEKVIIQKIIGLEWLNIGSRLTNIFAKKSPKARKVRKEIHNETLNTDPFVVNSSSHILIILKKK